MPNGGVETLSPEQQAEWARKLTAEQRLERARQGAKERAAQKKGAAAPTPSSAEAITTQDASQELTKRALNFSWANLIWSYGLTFLYIDLHFFLKYTPIPYIKDFFCKFGEEWLPPGKKSKDFVLAMFFGILEIFAVLFINGLILFLFTLLIVIIYIIFNPCELVTEFIPGLAGNIVKERCGFISGAVEAVIEFLVGTVF